MGMLQHRQVFTAIELYSELGRQLMETAVALQRGKNLRRQRPGIQLQAGIDARCRAEHQVAHIVGRRRGRPKACDQQMLDQRALLGADPANLQVGPVGGLDHPTGVALGGFGDGPGLVRTDHPCCQFDSADAAIARRDNAGNPGQAEGRRAVDNRDEFTWAADSWARDLGDWQHFADQGAVYLLCSTAWPARRNASRRLDGTLADSSGNR